MTTIRALFPLDGSEETYQAVEVGLKRLAPVKDARATFFVVIHEKFRNLPEDALEHLREDDEDELFIRDDEAEAVIDRAKQIAKRVRFGAVEGKVVIGDPKVAILDASKAFDVMVVHRLDRREKEEKLRGGFLESLVRGAHCDVWLVNTA